MGEIFLAFFEPENNNSLNRYLDNSLKDSSDFSDICKTNTTRCTMGCYEIAYFTLALYNTNFGEIN